jgi:hypothetical protein
MKYFFLFNTLITISSFGQNLLGGSKTSINNSSESKSNICNFTIFDGKVSCNSGYVIVTNDACCPETLPYYCPNTKSCYSTCEKANEACNGSVIKGSYSSIKTNDNQTNITISPHTKNETYDNQQINKQTQIQLDNNKIDASDSKSISWSVEILHKISKCKYCEKEYEELFPVKIISNGNSDGEIGVLEASKMYPNQTGKINFINQTCKGYDNPGYDHKLIETNKFKTTEYRTARKSDAIDIQNHIKNNFSEIEQSIFINNCIQTVTIALAAGK